MDMIFMAMAGLNEQKAGKTKKPGSDARQKLHLSG
jgi:hypothetical protein